MTSHVCVKKADLDALCVCAKKNASLADMYSEELCIEELEHSRLTEAKNTVGNLNPQPCHSPEKVEALIEALENIIDPDPCMPDHHGFCQSHTCSHPCANEEAKKAIAALDEN